MKRDVLLLSFLFLIISISLQTTKAFAEESYLLDYETINIKDISSVKIKEKEEIELVNAYVLSEPKESLKLKEVSFEKTKYSKEEVKPETPKVNPWHLPTETGIITTNPYYGHAAIDIISARGIPEVIYPVASGIVSGMYRDNAGALIVTILHNIEGNKYTSQYVHLSHYAANLFVGKKVTINDPLGRMGSSGVSTGIHLHLAVVDCALFDRSDARCHDLNSFYQYANRKAANGYWGLGNYLDVPGKWMERK